MVCLALAVVLTSIKKLVAGKIGTQMAALWESSSWRRCMLGTLRSDSGYGLSIYFGLWILVIASVLTLGSSTPLHGYEVTAATFALLTPHVFSIPMGPLNIFLRAIRGLSAKTSPWITYAAVWNLELLRGGPMEVSPLLVEEVVSLRTLGIESPLGLKTCALSSETTLCVQKGGHVVLVDIAQKTAREHKVTADAAIIHPQGKILALRAGRTVQLFDLEVPCRLKTTELEDDTVQLWKWVGEDILAIVNKKVVLHWTISGNGYPAVGTFSILLHCPVYSMTM